MNLWAASIEDAVSAKDEEAIPDEHFSHTMSRSTREEESQTYK
jgi:hypothetical protein